MATNTEKRDKVRKRYFWKWTGLSITLMILIVIALVSSINTWMAYYTRHDEYVNVPDLSNISDQDALQYLEHIGLRGIVIDSVYADATPGSVVDQLPIAGMPVRYGRIVYLTIEPRELRMITFTDNIRECSSREAVSRLEKQGFVVDSLRYVPYEYNDIVTNVVISRVERPLVSGKKYPHKSHVIIEVGTTNVIEEEETLEEETDGGEI